MGLGYKRTSTTGDVPVFQGHGEDLQVAQGGFKLDVTGLAAGAIIKAGTPMQFDEATRVAKPLTTGRVVENAASNAVNYKIAKGSRLKTGDYFAAKKGDKAYAITAISTDNADYDVVTVGTSIGALTAGDMVFASTATGASNAAFGAVNGLNYRDQAVADGESVSVVIRGTVYARRVPYSSDLEAALPKIIYSQSY